MSRNLELPTLSADSWVLVLVQVVTLWYRPPEILLGIKAYALPMDMWAAGAIIAEMTTKRPLFPGDCEIDQLFKIFRLMGTPTEDSWPGVTSLQDWNEAFPPWPELALRSVVKRLCDPGLDLVKVIVPCCVS
jgi:serine/threonine protein kinase